MKFWLLKMFILSLFIKSIHMYISGCVYSLHHAVEALCEPLEGDMFVPWRILSFWGRRPLFGGFGCLFSQNVTRAR